MAKANLGSPNNVHIALFINPANIAGLEPAIFGHSEGRLFGFVAIVFHDSRIRVPQFSLVARLERITFAINDLYLNIR